MNTLRALAASTTAVAVCATTLLAFPGDAAACGGFFCNTGQPVNQVGEHILFAIEDQTVSAHIQIQYQGPAERFSWVLPLPSLPELGVGTEELFTQLRQRTDPQFRIKWENEGDCQYQSTCDCYPEAAAGGDVDVDEDGDNQSGVNILAAGAVGPYDFKVVEAGDGDVLFDWLQENEYDVPDDSKKIVNWYSDIDFVFLALKLLKDKEAGDIQPIVLSYHSEDVSCIPLKLTSIAADPDMPVYSWVLGDARAIPLNYFHVVLNPEAYDWMNCAQPVNSWGGCGMNNCQQEYLDLVTSAANQANGRGFVTEYAGSTSVMENALWWEDRFDLEALAQMNTPGAFLQEMMYQGFPTTSQVQEVIKDNIPKPEDEEMPADCQGDFNFYAIWNIDNCIQYMPEGWVFDAAAMAADLDTRLAAPMAAAQGLLDHHPYMSRLFTTISPEEMTRDPIFAFKPDITNVHEVTGVATCIEGSTWQAETVKLIFPDGGERVYEGTFNQCGGWEPPADEEPETYPPVTEIQILGESGPPETVNLDEVDTADEAFDLIGPSANDQDVIADPNRNLDPIPRTGTFASPEPTTPNGSSGDDSGCNAGGGTSAPWAWLALAMLLGSLALRRRRSV